MKSWKYIWQAFYVLFSLDLVFFSLFSIFLSNKQSCTICYMYDVCTQFYVKNILFWHPLKWYICDSATVFFFSLVIHFRCIYFTILFEFVRRCFFLLGRKKKQMWLCTCETDQTLWSTQSTTNSTKIAASIPQFMTMLLTKCFKLNCENTFW